MVSTLLRHGAEATRPGHHLWSPLHEGAKSGRPDLVALLLRCGASVNQRDTVGATPLAVAAENGNLEVVEQLIHKGRYNLMCYTMDCSMRYMFANHIVIDGHIMAKHFFRPVVLYD